MPARILRSDVAQVNGLGVRYRVAAAFTRDLDLLDAPGAADGVLKPKALGEMLTRALAGVEGHSDPAALRARFEHEVRRLVPVRSVEIRRAPASNDADSIYFTVPGSGSVVLQTTFERDRLPSPLEFKVLKAAANLAAVLLEFAPFEGECQWRALA